MVGFTKHLVCSSGSPIYLLIDYTLTTVYDVEEDCGRILIRLSVTLETQHLKRFNKKLSCVSKNLSVLFIHKIINFSLHMFGINICQHLTSDRIIFQLITTNASLQLSCLNMPYPELFILLNVTDGAYRVVTVPCFICSCWHLIG